MKITVFPVLAVTIAVLLGSCNSKEVERLRAENDSLRMELNTRYSVVVAMKDVTSLLDSIDESRNALHINLREGTSYQEVTSRLTDINRYVKRTADRIVTLEKNLRGAKGNASAYQLMAEALKDELNVRTSEIEALQNSVETYKAENKGLIKTVKLQESELATMHTLITTKKNELNFLEAKVDEMVENFKVTEAEAYYARAMAVEEAAKRTKLAPSKKKETYREAMDLYKKAVELGKADAQAKVDELTKRLR